MLEFTKDYIERWNEVYDAAKKRGVLVGDELSTKDSDGPGGFVFIGKTKNSFFVKLTLDSAISLSDPAFIMNDSPKIKSGLVTFLCRTSVMEYMARYRTSIPAVRRISIVKKLDKIAICKVLEWVEEKKEN